MIPPVKRLLMYALGLGEIGELLVEAIAQAGRKLDSRYDIKLDNRED